MPTDLFHKKPVRGHGESSSRGVAMRSEPATVLSVNKDNWTVHAQPEGDDHIITNVPVLSPYEHVDGSGMYFLPRRGAKGLLLYYDRGGPRFMCYRSEAIGEQTYKGNKHDLDEGDMIHKTSYGSFLLMRDSGIIEVYSNPVLRAGLLPTTNTWYQQSERFDLTTSGGRWHWLHRRNNGLTARGETALIETYREYAHESPRVVIVKGFHDNDSVYSIDVDDGSYTKELGEIDDGTVVRTKVQARSKLSRTWSKTTEIGKQSDGDKTNIVHDRVESGSSSIDMKIRDDGHIDLAVNDDAFVLEIDKDGNTTVRIKDGSFLKLVCNDIRLAADDPKQKALFGTMFREYFNDEIKKWLLGHQHIGNMGSPTTPVSAIPSHVTSFPDIPETHLSDKVKVGDN